MPFLMLGEALVDLICEQAAEGIGEAGAFTPHFGGAAANVAVSAARAGGRPALAGGAGQDPWGQWLLERLRAEGVDTRWFALDQARQTPIAFATVAAGGEPSFAIYGEGISAALVAFGERADEAVGATEALVFASNTLVGPEREVTLRARDRARELGRPICFDPNLRLERWPSAEDAVEAARGCLEGCLLVKANANEARLLTGERDPAAAAEAIAALGVELVVITLGPDGALARGAVRHEVPGRAARVISTIGAGDAFFGTLLAGLQNAGWNPAAPSLRDTLGAAAEAGARATESWGAVA
jgi:sugar/nucleoside kinase (ribokinase family)